jgi:hypothetical protein
MVFRKYLVNKSHFQINHNKIWKMKPQDITLFLEKDTSLVKCPHAIKVVASRKS